MTRALATLPKAGVSVHEHAGVSRAHAESSTQPADPCDDSGDGGLKCCQAHAPWLATPVAVTCAVPPTLERATYAARWTSFLPEELSPPPIALLRVA